MNAAIGFYNFLISRSSEIGKLFLEHIELTVFSVIISILIGIPIGILITRVKKLSSPVIAIANIAQAIPSLALLGFLIPLLGIGSKPAVVMVILYSLLPIIKNTYTGLSNINPDMIEAAKGMGMTEAQILKMVQIPLALPIIMAGIRISAVTAVGLMTIAAFVGAGGLGFMVFTGVQSVNNYMILAGAIPACILALLMDFVIGKIEKAVTKTGTKKISKKVKIIICAVLCLSLIGGTTFHYVNKKDKIVIGGKNYTEQTILVNMIGKMIEENTDLKVEIKPNLGGTSVMFSAIKAGELDIAVEYTGTALVNIMKKETLNDPDKVYQIVKDYYSKEYNIDWLKPLGFNNTYALAVKQDTAKKYNLETISDLAKISNNLGFSCTMEFTNRPDTYKPLKDVYGVNFKDISAVDGGLRYTAVEEKKADVLDAFSTDGLLKQFNLKVLKDDKKIFPPYYAAPIIRQDTLEKHPELKNILNKLEGKLNDEDMMELNYKVDSLGERPERVAEEFLKSKGLIK